MRRTGVRASVYWNFTIHQIFPEFLQPFRDLRVQRVTPFYRGFLFYLFFGFSLAWVSSGCPDPSSTNSDTGTGEMSLLVTFSRSRTRISPTVGEEDEEEDDEERLSCFIGVREDDDDPEEELDKPGTTIETKFSVLQGIRIPF